MLFMLKKVGNKGYQKGSVWFLWVLKNPSAVFTCDDFFSGDEFIHHLWANSHVAHCTEFICNWRKHDPIFLTGYLIIQFHLIGRDFRQKFIFFLGQICLDFICLFAGSVDSRLYIVSWKHFCDDLFFQRVDSCGCIIDFFEKGSVFFVCFDFIELPFELCYVFFSIQEWRFQIPPFFLILL